MIWAAVSIIFGLLLILFPESIARNFVAWQKDNLNSKFGAREIRINKIVNVVVGAVFIALGVLVATGVVQLR